MSRLSRRTTFAWVAVVPVLVAACGGGTAPATPPRLIDPAHTAAQLGAVSAPTATRLFLSFTLLAPYFFRTDSTVFIPAASLALPPLGRWSLPGRVPLPAPRSLLPKVVESIRAAKDPLTVKDLAVKGDDLLAAGVRPGPDVGETLERLLAAVLEDPSRNTRDDLLSRV